MTTLKTPEELAKTLDDTLSYDSFEDSPARNEAIKIITQDRQHTAQVLCDLLEGEKQAEEHKPHCDGYCHESACYLPDIIERNKTLTKAQALIRQTLDPISNQE